MKDIIEIRFDVDLNVILIDFSTVVTLLLFFYQFIYHDFKVRETFLLETLNKIHRIA